MNDQVFSGFTALNSQPGAPPIAATAINVTPITTALMPGLLFTFNATATAGQVFDNAIGFIDTPNTGGNTVTGTTLTQNGGAATGNGGVVGLEKICFGAAFTAAGTCPGTPGSRNLGTFALANNVVSATDQLSFPASAFVGADGDFSWDSGRTGTASVTSFAIQFTANGPAAPAAIPEPSTWILSSCALLGLGVVRRWNTARSNARRNTV